MNNKLSEVRMNQEVSQKQLATLLNVSQKTISSWEIGRTNPKPAQMQHLEDIFDIPKEEIFFTAFNYKNELNDKEVV
ncbi:helix-turn-helix transcriptional regulator [Enterococcus sp. AZ103]|uniref:helix-turn-helix transcriptional regulator n=1 Tax=Enterococcus sp. AZ103 TaxID=2774628 RepID=UPI003F6832AE